MDLVFSVIMLSCSLFLLQGRNVRSLKSTSRYLGRSLLLQMSSTSVDASSKNEKALSNVRSLMDKEGIDAFVVPTDDPHMSEYTANYFARREFISGFTGSAGTVVLTKDQSVLFTDGRYHQQAEMQLRPGWTLMKEGIAGVPTISEFISRTMKDNEVLGIDPTVHNVGAIKNIENMLKRSAATKKISLKYMDSNPIDAVWNDRPSMPLGTMRLHPIEYAGKTIAEKIHALATSMQEVEASSLVVSALDEIAWLLNLRGSDVPCNPVFLSYMIVKVDGSAVLFIDPAKISPDIAVYLQSNGVTIQPYEAVFSFVEALSACASKDGKVWLDGRSINGAIYEAASSGNVGAVSTILEKESPIVIQKACKNEAELYGMRQCHLRDGAAMAEFWSELEERLATGETITEVDVDTIVTGKRADDPMFLETSFDTIAGVSENGAIMHYRAVPETCKVVSTQDMMLLDSGGQYLDGTTDVTRTVHLGDPSSFQKEMFTRVLKGHIGIDSRIFPEGTPGCLLDAYAREFLWEIGLNFLHGVGHGVGAALNVHEGPHRISPALTNQALLPGMVVSNEPGYYSHENKIGIRIENLLVVVEKNELGKFGGKGFLGFERLTHIPIQQKLIDWELMTPKETAWINTYHQEVADRVYPLLHTDRARKWLTNACMPHV